MYCKSCGKRLVAGAFNCPYCGSEINRLVGGQSFRDILSVSPESASTPKPVIRQQPVPVSVPEDFGTKKAPPYKRGNRSGRRSGVDLRIILPAIFLCLIVGIILLCMNIQILNLKSEYEQNTDEMTTKIINLEDKYQDLEKALTQIRESHPEEAISPEPTTPKKDKDTVPQKPAPEVTIPETTIQTPVAVLPEDSAVQEAKVENTAPSIQTEPSEQERQHN